MRELLARLAPLLSVLSSLGGSESAHLACARALSPTKTKTQTRPSRAL